MRKNPKADIDNKRQQLQIQLDLLEELDTQWRLQEEQNQKNIAMQFPFKDYEGQRQSYIRELLGNGFLRDEAIKKAFENILENFAQQAAWLKTGDLT